LADYINKSILSQAYLHIEPKNFQTEEDLLKFRQHLEIFARSRTNFYLYPGASIEIEFEEGSLKARITIMGTIFLLMQGVSNYPDFREGIRLIYNDSKRLAEYIVSESQFSAGSKHADVIRLEARTGIIGSIQKVISQLETIKSGANGSILATDLVKKLDETKQEINKLMDNIENDSDKQLIFNGLSEVVAGIPSIPKPPKDKSNPPHAIIEFQERRRRLRASFNIDKNS
jgi:hypothetical protein